MDLPIDAHDIEYAENYLVTGDIATALPLLRKLVEMVEEVTEKECVPTDKVQYFTFEDPFERLAYRRVEKDPRELVQLDVPLDRLYSALAFACIQLKDWESARDALMQAVRWNPMNCSYRLDLAEIFRVLGDTKEWSALSFSVVERASDAKSLARAYANLGQFLLDEGNALAASGCVRLALNYAPNEQRVTRLVNRIAQEAPETADDTDDHALSALAQEGVPTAPSADVAICLLMSATDAAAAGDKNLATTLTVRAHELVGEEACRVLVKMIRESDAELAAEAEEAQHAEG